MNENNTENMEELEEQFDELEGTEGEEETGETTGEIPEDAQQSDEIGSDGNGEGMQTEESALPAEVMEFITEEMEEIHAYLVERDVSVFEKPLSNYTTTEGLLLLVVLILTAEMIFKKIGGILRCEKE